MRSLLLAMNRWGTDDSAPPESNHPRISDGDLVLPQQLAFPRLPGVGRPADPHKASWVDYGPSSVHRVCLKLVGALLLHPLKPQIPHPPRRQFEPIDPPSVIPSELVALACVEQVVTGRVHLPVVELPPPHDE